MEAYRMTNNYPEEEDSLLLVYLCLLGSFLYFIWLRRDRASYKGIPAVGFSGTFTSVVSVLRCAYNPIGTLRKAYAKSSNGIFRFPTLTRWIVVVAKPKYVEELRKAPEDEVSASEAMKEILQLPVTVDSGLFADSELKSLLGAQLARNLPLALPGIHAEIVKFANELISSEEDEWKYIDEFELMTRICNRVVNQALVGTSLCQNTEFTNSTIIIIGNLERYARRLRMSPILLRPLFAFLFTPLPRIGRQLRVLLSKTLKERQEVLVKHGDPFPNDMITWFLSHDAKSEMPLDELVAHVLLINYLAVHPMAKVMSQALRHLARNPGCVKELRAEVERAIVREGWSKPAVDKMHKLDSFLKETMRLSETIFNDFYPNLTMARKTLRPITFSDGTTVPSNTFLFVGSRLLHMDARYYSQPDTFNPFRFIQSPPDDAARPPRVSPSVSVSETPSPAHSHPALPSTSSQDLTAPASLVPVSSTLPATSPTFLSWGHGKHACPGRFFAAPAMKLLLALFMVEFDFRVPPPPASTAQGVNEQKDREGGPQNKDDKVLWIEVKRRQPKSRLN